MMARSTTEEVYYADSLEQPSAPPPNGVPAQRVKRKRHRVPVACFNCRALKTKCDGTKPVCSTCASNGDDCQYSSKGIPTSSTVVMVNQQYLRSLEERMARLENGTRQDSIGDHNSPYSDMTVLPQTPASRHMSISNPAVDQSISSARNIHFSLMNPTFSNGSTAESPAVVSTDPDVFMGGVSFTQLILNAMNGRTLGIRHQSFSCPHDTLLPSNVIYQLPDEAHDLVHQFFQVNHTVSPIFHEPTIRSSFTDAINAPFSERPKYSSTLALLNMIFAVCLSHRPMDDSSTKSINRNPATISRHYYDIAMALLTPTLFRDWHISKVQALLLGARYLQCSNSPDECWNVLGLAIRIAHGLELHRAPPADDLCYVKEIKKRVWWACFSLDKLLSMIYGRPAAIGATANANAIENASVGSNGSILGDVSCPLPLDLDDECILADRVLYPSPKRVSSMSFSIEVAKLYRILEAATRLPLSSPSGDLSFDVVAEGEALAQSVLVLDERFQRWYAEVPPKLKLHERNGENEDKPLILALRANMVRMLIHRPSLSLSLRALSSRGNGSENGNITKNNRWWRANEGVQSSIIMHSRQICVGTAMETVELIGRRHEQTKRWSGTSWFNLYYLFNAILILVSHVVDPAYHNDRACLTQLYAALAMIKAMSSNHTFAQRAYSFLQQLLSCMDKSPPMASRRWDGGASTGTGTGTPTFGNLGAGPDGIGRSIDGMGRMGGTGPPNGGGGGGVDEELFAGLFDFTQDLSETYADIGSEMSAWFDEQGPVGFTRM